MSVEQNKSIIRRFFTEVYSGNEAIVNELIHPEYKHYVFGWHIPEHDGPQGVMAHWRQWREAFSDMRYDIKDLIGEGDKVVVRGLWTGTHQGPFDDYPPTRRRISVEAASIYRLAGGKIVEEYELWDSEEFFRQIRED
jgi:predicted ester cyclase